MIAATLLSAVLASGVAAADAPATEASAIRQVLASGRLAEFRPGRLSDQMGALQRFYAEGSFAPVWLKDGKPTARARQALALLEFAESHGLEPADYGLRSLEERIEHPRPELATETEVALSASLFRFLSDLHGGRVSPRQLEFEFDLAARRLDLAALVRDALARDRLPVLADEVAPRFGVYQRLRKALADYRTLARHPWPVLPVVKKLEPGQPYPSLAALARRLELLGDLPAHAAVPARYEGAVVDGVMRFQTRHGLAADGVVGRGSFEQLNTLPAARVRQIGLAMERFRWLRVPDAPTEKLVAVNIPEFRLRAMDLKDGRLESRFAMNVIVGKALDTRTPLFDEDMLLIDFKPFWNVPPSIAKGELLPKLHKNPGYLAKEDMEFVPVGGGPAVSAVTPENLAAVARGAMRIRQRPGAKNALGEIKFVLPNAQNIYLHYTGSPALFKKSRRDLSHGCIRVENPVALAKFVLEDQPGWTEERIRAAMAAEKSSSVRLARPIPVVIFYTTAVVEPNGQLRFLPDIYGHDRKLAEALRLRSEKLAGN